MRLNFFIIFIILLSLSYFVSNPILGVVYTSIAIIATIFRDKIMVAFLFIYYPLRPLLTTFNSGLLLLGDAIIITAFIKVLVVNRHHIWWKLKPLQPFIYFFVFLLLGSIAALIHDVTYTAIAIELRALGVLTLLVAIFAIQIWKRKDFYPIITWSIITSVLISLHGIIEKLYSRTILIPSEWQEWNLSSVNVDRVYGTLANPNVLANYLLIVFFLSFWIRPDAKTGKISLLSAQMIIFYTATLTGSRGAFLAMIIGFLIYVIVSRNLQFIKRLSLAVLLSLFLLGSLVSFADHQINHQNETTKEQVTEDKEEVDQDGSSFISRFKSMFSSETVEASTEWGRIYIVIKGLEIFEDQPLFGTGFGTFGDAATLHYSSPIYDDYNIPDDIYTDNQYIHILVATGIVGTLILLWFVISLLRQTLPNLSKNEKSLMISIIATLLTGCLYYNLLEDKSFMLYFYSLLGILLSRIRVMHHV
ncbi:O-antigen ligase family protein [Alkalibacillus sp. S2W]|uniref:O-antigen ligase family protein n=1 Tax=Alkalibacillus sp. S2W TaxID=3386553 RepID=UPI00398D3994